MRWANGLIWGSVLLAMLAGITAGMQQPASPDNDRPPHSGVAAGPSGPKAESAPPPVTQAINSVLIAPAHLQLRTFTGIISDSFCTRHHYMLGGATSAECTRYCLAHRGNYVLIVGNTIYTLQSDPGHVLDSLAGQAAEVTGAVFADNVLEIRSVGPATPKKQSRE